MSNVRVWGGVLVAIAACSDPMERRAPDPEIAPPLVRTDPADVAVCPYGGSVVSSGRDLDDDGMLDADEIEARTLLCSAAPVPPLPALLVRLRAEPSGASCTLAGTAVLSGPDRNGNGVLDDDEVTHTDFVCGAALLTRLAVEPAGGACVAGGVAFLVGPDRDHDGALGDDEVAHREVECGDVLSRDVALRDAGDAAALAAIAVIAGSLTVQDTALTELSLPQLTQVRGSLVIERNATLTQLALPRLQSIDGGLSLRNNGALNAIALPQLRRADSLVVDANAALADLRGLPALVDVARDIQISRNAALTAADLPVQQLGGDLTIDRNGQLLRVVWQRAWRGEIRITANAQLQTVQLEAPVDLVGSATIGSNGRLAHIAVASHQLHSLRIENNASLTRVDVTATRIRGDVVLAENGQLVMTLTGDPRFELEIDGALALSGPITTLALSTPLAVDGTCTIDSTQLATLGTPALAMTVHGSLALIGNADLHAVPPISLGGGLEVRDNAALATLGFLAGNQIDGDLIVRDNPLLQAAPSLASLQSVRGDVAIAGNPLLLVAFGPALTRVDGDLVIDDSAGLADAGLSGLGHVGTLSVAHAGALTDLVLPALAEASSIEIRGNPVLGHLGFPALHRADLGVFDNPHLPACAVAALFAGLLGVHQQAGNDEGAVCTP